MTQPQTRLTDLLARTAGGDRVAFSELYQATSAKLYGIVLRIVKRRDIADEIVQEVYTKVWQRAGDFDPARASPITWLATIARNRALDEVRRKGHVGLDDAPEAMNVADPQRLASDNVEAADDAARLKKCLDALEPGRADLVRLAYLEGWSREQLAAKAGAPVATIKTWLHRSLKQLKECLGR